MESASVLVSAAQQQSYLRLLSSLITKVDEFSQSYSITAPSIRSEVQDLKVYLAALLQQQERPIRSSSASSAYNADHFRLDSRLNMQGDKPFTAVIPAGPSGVQPHSGRRFSEPPAGLDALALSNHVAAGQQSKRDRRSEAPNLQDPRPPLDIQVSGVASGLTDIDQNDVEVSRCVDDMVEWLGAGSDPLASEHDVARPQSPIDQHHMSHRIRYECKDGVSSFYPTKTQWPCFEEVLRMAKSLGAEQTGFFKICMENFEAPADTPPPDCEACSYSTNAHRNGTYGINLLKSRFVDPPSESGIDVLEVDEAIAVLEDKLGSPGSLTNSRYCTDMAARSLEDRLRLGLSASPIWPLTSNRLDQTKVRVPGIHWPYAYRSNSTLGALFALHIEDFSLYSLNILYRGRKIWTIVPPSAKGQLETQIWTKRSRPKCAQFVRESATYVPRKVLRQWNVPYKEICQHPGEIIVTFPNAYHQGFSLGATLAEAVNYADDDWDPTQYPACSAKTCPSGFIGQDLMALRVAGQEQVSEDGDTDLGFEAAISIDGTAALPTQVPPRISLSKSISPKRKAATKHSERSSHVKRKKASKVHDRDAKKSATGDELSRSLSMVISLAKIPPTAIYEEFLERNAKQKSGYDENRCMLLTRLFFAIGSPDAICQLRDAYEALRSSHSQFRSSTDSIADSVRILDNLDANIHLFAIMHRFHLVSLCRHRDALLAKTRVTRGGDPEQFGRSETLVHRKLMSHAYPGLHPSKAKRTNRSEDEYTKNSIALTHRLKIGTRWSMLAEAFTPGILALVPIRGDYQLYNSDYEKLPAPALRMLIDVLKQHRGQFLQEVSVSLDSFTTTDAEYQFRNQDADALKHEEYDSPRLVELCKVEHALPQPAM